MHEWYREAPQNVEQYNYYGWDAFSYDQGAEPLNIPANILRITLFLVLAY